MMVWKSNKGQIAVILTLAMATLLGVIALCADVGVMYFNHMQLQKGSDASALAGASYLTGVALPAANVNPACIGEPDDAQQAACTYALDNGLATDSKSLTMNENVAPWPTPNIQVIATRSNLPYMFGRVIGLNNYKVAALAIAANVPVNGVVGLFPMGMQCNNPCTPAEMKAEYASGSPVLFDVKFTPAYGSAKGNWQWLDNGQGANGLGDAITNGMSGAYTLPADITTLPGNKGNAGPVKTAWANRFNSKNCPATAADGSNQDPCNGGGTAPPGSPCLVTVPAVDFAGITGKKSTPIEAFAQVYIEPSSTSTSITACFVKQGDPNAISGDPNATNLGSTIIRLYQ